jgi:sec-independent protein translocase protein TatB
MFDFDVGKLLLIGVVALIFIPPKDLPEALRQIGRLVGQARRMAGEFQNQFNEAIREAELTDLKDEFNHMKKTASLEGALAHVAEAIEPLESIGKANAAPPNASALPPQEALPPHEALLPQNPQADPAPANSMSESKS